MTVKLTFERILLWNPTTHDTRAEFHVFDPKKPTVLLHKTTSLAEAEKMCAATSAKR